MKTVTSVKQLLTSIGLSLLLTSAVTGQVHIKNPADRVTTVNQGGQLTFTCNSTAEGLVEWLFNGAVINATRSDGNDAEHQSNNQSGLTRPSSSAKYTFKRVPMGRTVLNYLTISKVQPRDAGSYTCRQIYADGVQLIVDTWRELHITEPTESVIEVDTGDNFTLSCVGYYDSNIVWYRMNQSISWPPDTGDGEQQNIVVTVDTNSDQNWRRLTLSRSLVRSNVAGNYHCRDENGHLAPSKNVTVKVTGHAPHEATSHKASGSGGRSSSIFNGLWLVFLLAAAVASSSVVFGRGPFAAGELIYKSPLACTDTWHEELPL